MMVSSRALGLVVALGCGVVAQACGPNPASVAQDTLGTLRLELSTDSLVIDRLTYVITGPGDFVKRGEVNLEAATRISATIAGLPAGSGFSIALSAEANGDGTRCAGSASFDVESGQTTPVVVAMQCREPSRTGSVSVKGVLNVCPGVDGLSATPDAVWLGADIALSAEAHDSDAAPAALSYQWTASSGTFSGAGARVTYTCTHPGSHTVSLIVSDGDPACDSIRSVEVSCSEDASDTFYTTKTPYRPRQDLADYEAPPEGFESVFSELLARHGSRGLSSVKYDAAAYNMWKRAADDGALTALGATLGDDITRLMRANALLGAGVAGISNPGYGNLSALGIAEQRGLAARMLARHAGYFSSVAARGERSLLVVSSGVDRAVDSAAFFSAELAKNEPGLEALLENPPAPTGYPANAPQAQPAGTNRFLLYFHKLNAKTDLVSAASDPYFATYQSSLALQAYAKDADLNAKLGALAADPALTRAARALLERLFTPEFVDKIENKTYTFANTGTFSFASDDGEYSASVSGDGKTTITSLVDAASMLYNLYIIAPALRAEADVDFAQYVPESAARAFAYLQDAQDFYQMGPGIAEANPVTYRMAEALLDDFFSELDALARADYAHAAKLRFTHAEIIVPFASLLGLEAVFAPLPKSVTYSYAESPWRGELVSPMAANVQWDVVADERGTLLVKMLYNEKETDFKAACEGARFARGSHYYVYDKLAACYSHVAAR